VSLSQDSGTTGPPPTAPQIRWAAGTDVGRFRKVNQDAYLMFACNPERYAVLPNAGCVDLGSSDVVLAISDGMGGGKLGHRASKLALSKLGDLLPRNLQAADAEGAPDYHDFLSQIVYEAHEAVNEEARHYLECEGMGATLTIGWVTPTSLHIGHVGDSRLYLYASGRLRQLTHDHTLVGHMQRRGELTEMQARNHPRRSALSQAIGAGASGIVPQLLSASLAPGDIYLFCSDGLMEGLWDKNVAVQLELRARGEVSLEETRDALMRDALETGGRDNITLIVAEVLEAQPQPEQ